MVCLYVWSYAYARRKRTNISHSVKMLPVSNHSNMMDPARTHVKSQIIIPSKNNWAENTAIITLFVEGEVRTVFECVGGGGEGAWLHACMCACLY
jgi:hypothetical protein